MALLLDLEIRSQSRFTKSLDDFYRYMYTQYKIDPNIGFEEAEMLSLLEISTKCTLSEFWIDYIEGTKELDFDHYLNLIGYEIVETLSDLPDWGMRFAKNNPHLVTNVLTDSPAMFAGIFVNDEILAINNFKYSQNLIKQIFDDKKYTKTLDIHLFRDGKLLTKQVNVEKAKLKEIEIRSLVDLTINQIESRNKFFATSYVKNSK